MNLFIATGNLGRDAEVRSTQSGTSVCGFTLAVKSGYGDRQKTVWIKCSLWGKRAEGGLPQYLTKGAQVAVSGELGLEEWQAQDGTTKTAVTLNVSDLDLVGGKGTPEPAKQPQQQPAASQPANSGAPAYEDDIPFMNPYHRAEYIV